MTITLSREQAEQALSALDESIEMVRENYQTNWRHGIPTRAAQLKGLQAGVEAHGAAIESLRSALAQQAEPAMPAGCRQCPHVVGDSYQRDCAYPDCTLTPPAEPSPAPDAAPPAPVEAVLYQYRRKVRFNGQAGEWDDISREDYLAIQKEIAVDPESRFEVRRLFAEPVPAAPSTTPQEAPATSLKDHEVRELVNDLRDIAVKYHATQQLRARISNRVHASLAKVTPS